MSFFKVAGIKTVCVAVALSLAPATLPAMPSGTPAAVSAPLAAVGQVFGTKTAEAGPRYYRGYRPYRGQRYYRRSRGGNTAAAAIIGGVVGLGVGAALANSRPRYYQAPPRRVYRAAPHRVYRAAPRRVHAGAPRAWTSEWYRYCAARYRSFDARSGTYQPYHGPRRLCR